MGVETSCEGLWIQLLFDLAGPKFYFPSANLLRRISANSMLLGYTVESIMTLYFFAGWKEASDTLIWKLPPVFAQWRRM